MTHRFFGLVAVVLLATALPLDLNAGTLTPAQFSLEFLMETQTETAVGIFELFGADAMSPLKFTSNIDPAAVSFTYSLMPGSTYSGQVITFMGTGSFNASTGIWTLLGSGTFGSTNWSTSGTDTITSPDVKYTSETDIKREGVKQADLHDVCEVDETKDTSKCNYFRTDKDGKMVGKAMPSSTDIFVESGKSTSWNFRFDASPDGFAINSTGTTTTGGGSGNFQTTIAAVPEPTSLILVGLALLGATSVSLIKRLA